MIALSSKDPVTRRLDLGLNATARIGAVCVAKILRGIGRVEVDVVGKGWSGWMTEVVSSDAVAM